MSVTRFDVMILLSMTVAIIVISFTFPALGFTADSVSESEIPEFTASESTFEVFIDRPVEPGYPSQGVLNRSSDQFDSYEGHFEENFGAGTSGGDVFLVVQDFAGEVRIVNDTEIVDNHTFTSAGEEHTLAGDGFSFLVHSNNISLGTYEYVVETRPEDKKWYVGIPVIGGIFTVTDQTPAVIAWVGAWIAYAFASFAVGSLNLIVLFIKIITFLFNFVSWIITTYTTIISNSPSPWVSVFVGIPGALLSFVFAKLAILGIKMVPGL